jgi:hypothetical protein
LIDNQRTDVTAVQAGLGMSALKAWFALWVAACFWQLAMVPAAQARSDDGLGDTLMQIRQQDQRLQDIGWKLATANADYCSATTQSIGLQMVDVAGYRRPDDVRQAWGLQNAVAAYTIASGSPAQRAGVRVLDGIVSIDGDDITGWPAESHSDWRRLTRVHDTIEQSLEVQGQVSLVFGSGDLAAIQGVEVCKTRFELAGKNTRAVAEGSRVIIGRNFPGFSYDEDEFAAAIAHEMAHNVLFHRVWLDANGRGRKNIRKTEKEADRLMPWLLANAGYDPAAAIRFMERWGPRHGGGLFRKRTHDGWDERVEFIAAEVAVIQGLKSNGPAADWATHFAREIEPD